MNLNFLSSCLKGPRKCNDIPQKTPHRVRCCEGPRTSIMTVDNRKGYWFLGLVSMLAKMHIFDHSLKRNDIKNGQELFVAQAGR